MAIKPLWSYGIQVWGPTRNSDLEILEGFHNKLLRILVGILWFVPTHIILKDLKLPIIGEKAVKLVHRYITRLEDHPNLLSRELLSEFNNPRFHPLNTLESYIGMVIVGY